MNLRERKKQQTRQSLLAIAEELFSSLDYDQVMVDEIAARANISQKTFFNYFPSKARLLEELLLNWLREINIWSYDSEITEDPRSVLVPPNLEQIQNWVIKHRHILQMIMQHTELFASVYSSREEASGRNMLFPPEYRKPRLDRVAAAQEQGIIRKDIDPGMVCDMYDYLRMDIVQGWLRLPEGKASPQGYKNSYNMMLDVLCKGLAP